MSRSPALVPTPEQRRLAAGQFDRAGQLVALGGFRHGIELLRDCCRLDPANLIYRQALRRAQRTRHGNNGRGSWLAWLWNCPLKVRLRAARRRGDHLLVFDLVERILVTNPWDVAAQIELACSAEQLGLLDLAIWSLEQAGQGTRRDRRVDRQLALLYERRGNFGQALALWQLIHEADPTDAEAAQRAGNALPSSDQTDEPALLAAVEQEPTGIEPYLNLVRHYRRMHRVDQAHDVLQRGLAATGQAFALTVELGEVTLDPFRRDLALTEYHLQTRPQDEGLNEIRARLRKEINTRELDLFRLQADRAPHDRELRLQVGVRLLISGQPEEALGELLAAAEDPVLRPQVLLYLGLAWRARRNWPLARRHLEELLSTLEQHDDRRKDVLYELAVTHAEAGDWQLAINRGQELVTIHPDHRDIRQHLTLWQARLEQARPSA